MSKLEITDIAQQYLNELYSQQDKTIGKIEGARELYERIRKEIKRFESSGIEEAEGSESIENVPRARTQTG